MRLYIPFKEGCTLRERFKTLLFRPRGEEGAGMRFLAYASGSTAVPLLSAQMLFAFTGSGGVAFLARSPGVLLAGL